MALEVARHHLRFDRALVGALWRGSVGLLIVIVVSPVEVTRPFVLVGTAVLHGAILVSGYSKREGGSTSPGCTYICVSGDELSHVPRRVLI